VLAGGLGLAACGRRAQARPAPARTLSQLGVDRFATRDQHAALQRAFDAAREGGFALEGDGDARYRHDGALRLRGVSLDGRGCSLLSLSDGPRALRCTGSGWRLANIRLLGGSTVRTTDPDRNGVTVGDDEPASDFVLEDVAVDGVEPGRGVSGGGLFLSGAARGRIIRPVVRATLADGIHSTNGSHDLLFTDTLSENTGDDGFAVVSYVQQGRVCRNIRLTGGISRGSLARGFSVLGGRDVVLERVRAEGSTAAGVFLCGEDAWNTYGVQRCRVSDATAIGCVTGRGQDPGFLQGAVLVGGRAGTDLVDGEPLPRAATGVVLERPVVRGAGRSCTAALVLQADAVAPRITGARFADIRSGNPGYTPNGIELGGQDVAVAGAVMTDVAGLAVAVTPTARGICVLADLRVSGSRLGGRGPDSFVHVDGGDALARVEVRGGVFARGPGRIATENRPGRLRLTGSRLG
jgi:hypothetical protein